MPIICSDNTAIRAVENVQTSTMLLVSIYRHFWKKHKNALTNIDDNLPWRELLVYLKDLKFLVD